jgi:hypothetical protein
MKQMWIATLEILNKSTECEQMLFMFIIFQADYMTFPWSLFIGDIMSFRTTSENQVPDPIILWEMPMQTSPLNLGGNTVP